MPTLPPTINRSVDLWTLKPQLLNCTAFTFVAYVPTDDVQKQLPPGYEAQGFVTPIEVQVNFAVTKCGAFVINNETVIRDVTFGQTEAIVAVNESLSKGSDVQLYFLELFASNQSVVSFLTAMGFRIGLAEFEWNGSDTTTKVVMSVAGTTWYVVEGGNGGGPEQDWAWQNRWHQELVDGRPGWINFNLTFMAPKAPAAGTLMVEAGLFKSFRPADNGAIAGGTSINEQQRAELTFGRL